ncbi:hypothetical protein DVH05_017405 [Phytophthora capsici]|nr:hypothetical protein DVH05_017405 [Phytophthora capsici]
MTQPEAKLLPWGRLVLLTKNKNSDVPEHFDLLRSKHHVGRVSKRSDLLITKHFISGLHCSIHLRGKDDRGEPVVEIEDHSSRHGTYLNGKKIGHRRSGTAKKGDRINFSAPGAAVAEIAYKLEILPSGLTKQNEELHARLSADEKSVAGRTRKRIHEELQPTQSPTTVVRSPPRPRPTKKLRLASLSQQSSPECEPASQSGSEISNTPATQQSAQVSGSQPSKASGKRRLRPDTQSLKKQLEEAQKECMEYANRFAKTTVSLQKKSELLEQVQKDVEASRKAVEASRKEIEALKKAHEEELKKVKAQAAAELAKKDEDKKKIVDALVHERNVLKETLNLVLADPTNPRQVRTIAELTKTVNELERRKKNAEESLDVMKYQQDQTETTPPSKREAVRSERVRQKEATMQKGREEYQQKLVELSKSFMEIVREGKALNILSAEASLDPSNLSGSSQSQDSIDAGQIRQARRSSHLSAASNEHSEPSPPDVATTAETVEETKIDGKFDRYGAIGSTSNRPETMSGTQVFRSGEQLSQRPQGTVEDEETKGGDEETKGGDEETNGGDEETNGGDEETKGGDEETKGE